MDIDIYLHISYRSHIRTVEGPEPRIVEFLAPVPTQEFVVEVDANFGDVEISRNHQRTNEIITPIRANLRNGNLKNRFE